MDSISLKTYFKDLRKIELISGDEQIELAVKAKAGDQASMDKLVKCNLRFVLKVAKEYSHMGLPMEDLISEGNIGLIKSVNKFDETKGFKFISYAVWWIRQSMLQAVYEHGSTVRLPINRINVLNKINKARESLVKKFNREPTEKEISELADITEEELRCYMLDGHFEVSLNSKVSEDSDGAEIGDFLEGGGLDDIEGGMNKESLTTEIKSVLSKLTKREAEIIKLYFGLGGKEEMTLREIGESLDLTNERVRQIKEFALRKLRGYNKSSKLREFLNTKIG